MATRSNIVIRDEFGDIILYHHYDGYPETVGARVKQTFSDKLANGFASAERIAKELVCLTKVEEDGYTWDFVPTTSIHADIQYLYLIDCESETFTGYKVKRWNMSLEEIVNDKNIVKVPDSVE